MTKLHRGNQDFELYVFEFKHKRNFEYEFADVNKFAFDIDNWKRIDITSIRISSKSKPGGMHPGSNRKLQVVT